MDKTDSAPLLQIRCTEDCIGTAGFMGIRLRIEHKPLENAWNCFGRGGGGGAYLLYEGPMENTAVPIQGHTCMDEGVVLDLDYRDGLYQFAFGYYEWRRRCPGHEETWFSKEMRFSLHPGESHSYRCPVTDVIESFFFYVERE